jgi:hypothetical protein
MGSSRWSDDFYHERAAHRAATGASAFAYHDAVSHLPASARRVHPQLDPLDVKFRESRDSDTHPVSRAIAVIFDVTGSMGGIPVTLQTKLSELMNLLIRRGYVEHPQILFGAVGDATCDRAPLQIGQFESGIEMEDDLARFYLEGGGGGQNTESYELAAYFMARHTALDCYEKRGQKGFLFLIGDEEFYPAVSRRQVRALLGDPLEADIPTSLLFAELRRRFEVFMLIPRGASNSGNRGIKRAWQSLLGQNVMELDDPAAVCETIALSIGLAEGKVDLAGGLWDLRDMGVADRVARSVSTALATYARHTPVRRVAAPRGLPGPAPRDSAVRM